jgi:hypothetical protein
MPQGIETQTAMANVGHVECGGGNVSGKVCVCDDPQLEAVVAAWPTLPAAMKAVILATVAAAGSDGG